MRAHGKRCSRSKRALPRFRGLEELTEAHIAKLVRWAELVDEFLAAKRTSAGAEKVAAIMGISRATLWRRIRRYQEFGRIEALDRPRTSGGRGKSRLDPQVEAIIQKELKRFRRKCRGQKIVNFVVTATEAIEKAGLKAPDPDTLRNRFEALTKREKTAFFIGGQAARDDFDVLKGETPECSFPLERCQIDHTPGDCWIVSEDRSTVLGRPYTSLDIDDFSRIPLAIHVSLAHPSSEELAETIALSALPKDEWLDSLGLDHMNFPFFGSAHELFLDKAAEHRSAALKTACLARQIRLDWRNRTSDGGIIERLIGHAMVKVQRLDGATIFSATPRKDDQVNPSTTARLTMKEYLRELITYFWGEYTFELEHPELGMTPAQKWVSGLKNAQVRTVRDPFDFYLDLLPSHPATCQRYGVQVAHLRYNAPEFQAIVNDFKSEDIVVKIDMADVSRAFVRSPANGRYIELSNPHLAGKGITRCQWNWHVQKVKESISRSDWRLNRKVNLKKILFHLETGILLSKFAETLEVPSPIRTRGEARRAEHNDHLKERSRLRLPVTSEPIQRLTSPPLLHKPVFKPFELA